mmetsp:Transcript_9754/g.21716  ORF Transcript_9754/g.21716 Transcript_9754/m.21716 type:complete len:326 (-) Transcript_9754:100-1077(-)
MLSNTLRSIHIRLPLHARATYQGTRCVRQLASEASTAGVITNNILPAGSSSVSHTVLSHSNQSRRFLRKTSFAIRPTEWNIQSRSLSTSNDNTQTPPQQSLAFLTSLGYTESVSNGIIDALLQNGIPSTSLMGMIKSLAGRYEVGEDGGLEALAASVKLELEKTEGKGTVMIWCLPSTGWSPAEDGDQLPKVHSMERAFAVEATEGTTLTDVAKFGTSDNCDVLGEYLECACSGIMACSTCHVVIHPDWYNASIDNEPINDNPNHSADPKKIGAPSEAEQDMIDLAYQPQITSRLGCQIVLTKELDGMVVLLPGSNNLMDFVPFE